MSAAANVVLVAAPKNGKLSHILELDGVRGIAVLLVLVAHLTMIPRGHPLFNYLALGTTGVQLFFVLSGFLITRILLVSKDEPEYFKRFYLRRALRIFPLYYAVLIAYFWVIAPLTGAATTHQAWYWFYLMNYVTSGPPRLDHFWTLAIEEQFYLVWPLIVLVVKRKWLAPLCLSLAGCVMLARFTLYGHVSNTTISEATLFSLDPLAIGAAIAATWSISAQRENMGRFGLIALATGLTLFVAAVILGNGNTHSRVPIMIRMGNAGVALIYGGWIMRILAHSSDEGFVSRFLRAPAMTNIGKYSYAIYVLHYPLAKLTISSSLKITNSLVLASLLSLVAGFCLSYALAALSWRFLEQPCLRLKDRLAPYGAVAASIASSGNFKTAKA